MLSDTFANESQQPIHNSQNSQVWLNIETYQLKNEVSELQRILDEINQSTRMSQEQIFQKRSIDQTTHYKNSVDNVKLHQNLGKSPLSSKCMNQADQYKRPLIIQSRKYSNEKQNENLTQQQSQLSKSLSRTSNLKQPTKISRNTTNHFLERSNTENINLKKHVTVEKGIKPYIENKKSSNNLKLSQQDKTMVSMINLSNNSVENSLDTSIQNKFNKIINQLDDEIEQDEILTSAIKQKQQQTPIIYNETTFDTILNQQEESSFIQTDEYQENQEDKETIEDELLKMKETLELIKHQENMLLSRISQDDIKLRVTQTVKQSQQSFGQDDFISLNIVRSKQSNIFMQDDSCVLMTENDDNYSELSNLHLSKNAPFNHQRNLSKQSFGCRSLNDFKNSIQAENHLTDTFAEEQEQVKEQKNAIKASGTHSQLFLNSLDNSEVELQIETPRTNASNIQLHDDLQKPKVPHIKKDSLLMLNTQNDGREISQEMIISQLHESIQEIQLRQQQDQDLPENILQYHEIQEQNFQHAFNTSRTVNKVLINDDIHQQTDFNQTPRESIQNPICISERNLNNFSNSRQQQQTSQSKSKSRSRNNFDYSKISKHQSIAKIFESRRISKKQQSVEKTSMNKTVSEFEFKRTSTSSSLVKFSERQSINSQIGGQQNQTIKSNNTQNNFDKERLSVSKDKTVAQKKVQNYQQKNLRTLGYRETLLKQAPQNTKFYHQNQESSPAGRLNIVDSISNSLNQMMKKVPSSSSLSSSMYPSVTSGSQSTRNFSNLKSNNFSSTMNLQTQQQANINNNLLLSQQNQANLTKDHSLVRLRKLELEQEKKEKLLQKVQQKEHKINQLVNRKVEDEKFRKEPQTIYEKTMRIKQRIDDRRVVQKQGNHTYIEATQQISTQPNALKTYNKTPSRNKKVNVGMIYNKTFNYEQSLKELQNDEKVEEKYLTSPYKFGRLDMPLKRVTHDRTVNNRYNNQSLSSASSFLNQSGISDLMINQSSNNNSFSNNQNNLSYRNNDLCENEEANISVTTFGGR
eukprot:403373591